jgi:hypothetical protein
MPEVGSSASDYDAMNDLRDRQGRMSSKKFGTILANNKTCRVSFKGAFVDDIVFYLNKFRTGV